MGKGELVGGGAVEAGGRETSTIRWPDVLVESGGEARRKRGVGRRIARAMAQLLGASSSKKRRPGEEGEGFEVAAAAAAQEEEDRISALPEDLRLRILALLLSSRPSARGRSPRGGARSGRAAGPRRPP